MGSALVDKGVARGGDGVIRAGEGQDFWCGHIL